MDVVIQTILMVSIILLTAVFLVAGVFIIVILREVQQLSKKLNQIVSKSEGAIDSVNQALVVLPQLASELKDSVKAWGVVKLGISALIDFLEKKGIIV